jgi:signal transduction histidine kinase
MHPNAEVDMSARFDCGRTYPRRVQVDTALASMTPMLRCLAGSAVELTTCSTEPIPPVLIEPLDLERIATALVANARNAMPHGGRIRISTSTVDAPPLGASLEAPERRWVLVEVDDDGVGMDDETLSRALAGSGTGLPSVLRAVRGASGELRIHSDVGRGTRVQVRLPVW